MTKLQLLRQYLTERLMEAVREILEVVGDTVSEYQEETARAQRENESLRRRLREVVLVAEAPWAGESLLPSCAPAPHSLPWLFYLTSGQQSLAADLAVVYFASDL